MDIQKNSKILKIRDARKMRQKCKTCLTTVVQVNIAGHVDRMLEAFLKKF